VRLGKPRLGKPTLARHAVLRAAERLGLREGEAARYLTESWQIGVTVPVRWAGRMRMIPRFSARRIKGNSQFMIGPGIVMVCSGRCIVTCWRLTDEQMWTVLMATIFGLRIALELMER